MLEQTQQGETQQLGHKLHSDFKHSLTLYVPKFLKYK